MVDKTQVEERCFVDKPETRRIRWESFKQAIYFAHPVVVITKKTPQMSM